VISSIPTTQIEEIQPLPLPSSGEVVRLEDPSEGRLTGGSDLLRNRVCVVIGGGSIAPGWGIGKAITAAYAREGAMVVVADINVDSAEETAALVRGAGASAVAYEVDVTVDKSIADLIGNIHREFGVIDVLHNNVGLAKSGDPGLTSAKEWRWIQDGNVTALHIAAQLVLPQMKQRRKGVILTTSSIAAQRHLGYSSLAYATTKAAALHFTKTLAIEYASYGIRANTIIAGLIDTPRIQINLKGAYTGCTIEEMRTRRHRVVPLGRMGDAWDVAEAAVFLASDRARYITGTELVVDGGLSATVPH